VPKSLNITEKMVLGTAQFGMNYGIANRNGQVHGDEIAMILDLALQNGIDTLDTAKAYGNSEEAIGSYLSKRPEEKWYIITKLSAEDGNLKKQYQESKERLGCAPWTILAHRVSDYLDETFCENLHALKKLHDVQKVGVSIYTVEDIQKVLSVMLPDIIQLPINILDTKLLRTGALSKLKDKNIEIHVRSVFLQGLFYLPEIEIVERFPQLQIDLNKLSSLAASQGLTLPELSLLYVTSLPEVDKVVVGVENASQLEAHFTTLAKTFDESIPQEILDIEFEDETVLNPVLWD